MACDVERHGPWALVTGASSGIGEATALQLSERGLSVVLVARRHEALAAVAERMVTPTRVLALDLTEAGAIDALVEGTRDLDIGLVVHSAGFGLGGDHLDHPLDAQQQMLQLNCAALLDLVHAYTPGLIARGRGGLVLLSSALAFCGVPHASHYAATKAWVQTLGEGLAHELQPHGLDVLVVAPGPTDTPFFARAGMTASVTASPHAVASQIMRRLGDRTTLLPDLFAWAITWSLAMVPRWMRVRIMDRVMAGMTAQQT
jgi:hypothetical protein